jgi:Nucleotidyl transferase AbiEii toxin, Type IV TA system
MPASFTPRLEILPPPQRRLWDELRDVPPNFVLYGGTAIALHLGHRQSIDFDFFSRQLLDPDGLIKNVRFMAGATATQMEPNAFSASIDRGGEIKVSFFCVPDLVRVNPPVIAEANGLKVASLEDLAGTKAKVVLQRAEAKDYLDIDALLTSGSVDLPTALACAQIMYGNTYSPQSTLKALSYFEDGNLQHLPKETKDRLVKAAREVDLDRLPNVASIPDREIDRG